MTPLFLHLYKTENTVEKFMLTAIHTSSHITGNEVFNFNASFKCEECTAKIKSAKWQLSFKRFQIRHYINNTI